MNKLIDIKVKLLELDMPNKNGHIYPKEAFQKIIDMNANKEILGTLGFGESSNVTNVNLKDVAFTAGDLRIEGDSVYATVRPIATPKGQILSKIISDCAFRTAGLGQVDSNGVVSEFSISYIAAVPKDEAA